MVLLSACGPPAPTVRPDPHTDPAEQRIEAMADRGELDEAARAWLVLAEERPEQATSMRLRATDLFLQLDDIERAVATLDMLDREMLRGSQIHHFDLAQAELALLQGDLATAGWLLARDTQNWPEDLIERHALLEERLRQQLDNPTRQSFAALEQSLYDGDFSPDLALALMIEHPLSDLEALLLQHAYRPELLPWLELVVSARRFLLDDTALERAMMDWEQRYPTIGYRAEEALFWLSIWRQTYPAPNRIAVVLPGRSGMARVSAALRDGLISAWLEWPPERRPELVFEYIDDDPGAVLSAWFDIRESGADFMLGPLERHQVDSLLTLPDPGLPILMLNHPTDPDAFNEATGPVFAIGLLPEEEAELAAIHALARGHERALVLAQNTDWGQRVASAFSETFRLGGGQILGNAEYATDQVDHSALLEVLLELDRSEQRANRLARVLNQPIESEAQRRTDVDLIFLASRVEDGRQIRPQLRFFGAGDLPVLATSQIIAGSPDRRRDEDLDGIELPLSPWFLDFTAQGERRRRAESIHGHLDNPNLSRLHALGFDALNLVPWLDLMRADESLYLAGLSGRLRLADGHRLQRELPFVRLIDGRAEPVR